MRVVFVLMMAGFMVWGATDVSRAWMQRLQRALRIAGVTPKAMAIHMQLTERQIYDQLALRQPMQAPRLEEVFAAYPEAQEAYCIDVLESRGYRVYREEWLHSLVDAISSGPKTPARMTLPHIAAQKEVA